MPLTVKASPSQHRGAPHSFHKAPSALASPECLFEICFRSLSLSFPSSSKMATQEYDILILGGGQSGIVAARFYLDVHPTCRLAIVERDGVVGGTWSKGMETEHDR